MPITTIPQVTYSNDMQACIAIKRRNRRLQKMRESAKKRRY